MNMTAMRDVPNRAASFKFALEVCLLYPVKDCHFLKIPLLARYWRHGTSKVFTLARSLTLTVSTTFKPPGHILQLH
jgi:hypothetical protein